MPELYVKATQKHLGHISDDELEFLMAQLEVEDSEDTDYAIDRMTLEYMKANGLSAHLAQLLDEALGDGDETEITYTQS
jgi:hypothetical protein